MAQYSWIPILFVVFITVATIGLGVYATKASRTASDFFVAGRGVSVFANASAISGEYLSAASFLGVAGLVMKNGYDALWYPVGYAAGYLLLLLFIAGPLRRFGAYTIPDFAEGRFDSPKFRKIAVIFVLFIGFFYTMPQMKAAGVTLGAIMGWPYYAGIIVVGTVITFNVAIGGMKGITFVQAFQYWVKMFAISAPIFVLMLAYGTYGRVIGQHIKRPTYFPIMDYDATVKIKGAEDKPANAISLNSSRATLLYFAKGAVIQKVSPAGKPEPADNPIPSDALSVATVAQWKDYTLSHFTTLEPGPDGMYHLPPNTMLRAKTYVKRGRVAGDGSPSMMDSQPKIIRNGIKLEFKEAVEVFVPGSQVAPNMTANAKWLAPFGTLTSKDGYPLLYTYSLIIALICGTAGLPHILVRFYTNPDGRAAKRTTLAVMVMLGVFYVCTPIWGALGRMFMSSLYINSATDVVVIKLPGNLENKFLAALLTGITSAGAFAAFMSTFSGLLVSMSGAMAHDIYGKIIKPTATPQERMTMFKYAAIGIGIISMALGLLVSGFDIAKMVGWAFAIGAASYFPLLLLGAWWRGLTKQGAAAGMVIGGTASLVAIVSFMLLEKGIITAAVPPLARSLIEQPAIWGVPLSIIIMVVVSKMTASSVPNDIAFKMLRLHAPEEMGHSENYIVEH